MKFHSPQQVQELSRFRNDRLWTTSLYLDTDKSRLNKKEIALALKNLLGEGRARIDGLDTNRTIKESLGRDLDLISRFGSQSLPLHTAPGLAIFSCAGADFWQDFSLPRAPRNHLFFDRNPYVRPLTSILDEYRSIGVAIFERQEARWYKIFMEEIVALDRLAGDVPSRVREGGWQGYESKRIERHIDAHLREHFKRAAEKTFALFKKNRFDWLLIGCKEEYRSYIEPLLHPYLKERFKGWLKTNSGDPEDRILKQAVEIEKQLKKQEEEELAKTLVAEVEKGGRAVTGLKDVLRRLNATEVQTLVLTRNFSREGRICPKCRFLYLDELRCPVCEVKTDKVADIVHESVHAAMDRKVKVRYVTPPSRLDRYGKIGAFLRF